MQLDNNLVFRGSRLKAWIRAFNGRKYFHRNYILAIVNETTFSTWFDTIFEFKTRGTCVCFKYTCSEEMSHICFCAENWVNYCSGRVNLQYEHTSVFWQKNHRCLNTFSPPSPFLSFSSLSKVHSLLCLFFHPIPPDPILSSAFFPLSRPTFIYFFRSKFPSRRHQFLQPKIIES